MNWQIRSLLNFNIKSFEFLASFNSIYWILFMVSLMNNGGMRFYAQNDNLTPSQYPLYLYDPYTYPPNFNCFEYQQNLMYSQNSLPVEQKKTKKSKKKTSNEKSQKDNQPSIGYTKSDLISWLLFFFS